MPHDESVTTKCQTLPLNVNRSRVTNDCAVVGSGACEKFIMGMYLLQSCNKIIEEELPLPLRLSNIRASITYGKYNWELRKHLFFHLVKSSSSLALSLDTASMMSSHSSALALSSSPGSLSSHSLPIERNGRLSPLCGSQSKLPRILSSPAET